MYYRYTINVITQLLINFIFKGLIFLLKYGKRSKSTRDQNPPAFKIHQIKIHPFFFCLFSLLINLFYVFFAFFKIYIFYHSYPLPSIGKRFSNLTGWVLIGWILNAGGF